MVASITTIVLQYRGQPCWSSHFLPCAWGDVMRIQRQAVCIYSVYEDNEVNQVLLQDIKTVAQHDS